MLYLQYLPFASDISTAAPGLHNARGQRPKTKMLELNNIRSTTNPDIRAGNAPDFNARAIHSASEPSYGQPLSPNANVAHKNNFHMDMKLLRHKVLCE